LEKKHWLSYMNLSDHYERKARFLPGLLSVLFLLPVSAALGGPLASWIKWVAMEVGVASAYAVGISHLASAFGNRFQKKLWPRWPYDSATNQWLLPIDTSRSDQQKAIWYAAIKRLTGLDIPLAQSLSNEELEKVINDAVIALRYRLRNSEHADRLRVHNVDYGFARNFTGLYPLWLTSSVLGFIGCLATYFWANGQAFWCIVSAILMLAAFMLAFLILPDYVRQRASGSFPK